MKLTARFVLLAFIGLVTLVPFSTRAVSETDLPGHSLFLHIKQWAAPFPGPGNYTIDFTAAGHGYSTTATGAVTSASGTWSFRQGDINGSVVITLENYFGDGTGADIVLLLSGYYELYAGTSNQDGNWSLDRFVQDPIISTDLVDLTGPENGSITFFPSLLNGTTDVTFQWFKDGVEIPGANKANLALTGLNKSMEGLYSFQVSKGIDTNLSRAAQLTVVPPEPATFAGRPFVIVLTNNAPVPGLQLTEPTNAFRLKNPTKFDWQDGELTFQADYAGTGTNKNKTGFGLFAISNGVPRKLILNSELMPGTSSPYTSIGGYNEPSAGQFLFNAVARSSGGTYIHAVLKWDGNAAMSLVTDQSPIPGNESSQFQFFGVPGGVGLGAAFAGYGTDGAAGFYQFTNGTVIKLLDNNTVLPGFPMPPLNLDAGRVPAGDAQDQLFTLVERNTGTIGVFLRHADGSFEALLDANAYYPGTSQRMTQINGDMPVRLGNTSAFLLGNDSVQGYVVSADDQGLHAIATVGDPLPPGRGHIQSIGRIGLTDLGVVFEAYSTMGRTGVYLSHDGQVTTVMDLLSQVGTNIVTSVGLRSASATNVVLQFSLYPSGASGTAVNIGIPPITPLVLERSGSHFTEDGHFSLNASGPAGQSIVLEHSIDLIQWEPVTTNTLIMGPNAIMDPFPRAGQSAGFYRVKAATP